MDLAKLEKISEIEWRIAPTGPMRVPAVIYADEALIRDMDDKVYEQMTNVATLPGIVGARMPCPTPTGDTDFRSAASRRSIRRKAASSRPAASVSTYPAVCGRC